MTVLLTAALIFHTGPQLEAWEADWASRMLEGETVELIDEWQNMTGRHVWYFDPQPEEVMTTADSVGTVNTPPAPTLWPGNWEALVATYFRPEDVQAALHVIDCESHFSLTAKNPISSALGPWQFLRDTWDRMVAPHTGSPSYDAGGPTDPVWSTINAAWLWYNVGPSQWTCW